MRKLTKKTAVWSALFALLFFIGCDPKEEVVNLIPTVKVQVELPEGYDASEREGLTVTIKGVKTDYTAVTDSIGEALFEKVFPDYYTISVSKNLSPSLLLSGQLLNHKILVNADGEKITLPLLEVLKASFVISKVYSAGTKDNLNKNYTNDVFVEFFNNSTEELVLDSTYYFAFVEAESTPAFPAKDSVNYLFARQVFRFIGDASTKTVAPGASIVVANSAVDHTADATLSVNLTVADFEAKDLSGKVLNNPSVPALERIYSTFATISNMNIGRSTINGVVLFSTTENVWSWPSAQIPGKPTSNNYYKRIPINTILDGIEILRSNITPESVENQKRISKRIDQGFVTPTVLNGLNREVIARKIEYVNGVLHLKDTNNSTNDCTVSDQIKPKEYNY